MSENAATDVTPMDATTDPTTADTATDVTPMDAATDVTPADADVAPADAATDAGSEDAAAETSVEVAGDGVSALVVASFASLDEAREAYEQLKEVEDGDTLRVDGVVILTHDDDGKLQVVKVTDHSTRSGLAWGALGGVLVGVFFPPSILAAALVGGAAGAVIGKARQVHHKNEIADELAGVIGDDQSGLIALVTDPRAEKLQKALDKADRIVTAAVDEATADDLRAAARDADSSQ